MYPYQIGLHLQLCIFIKQNYVVFTCQSIKVEIAQNPKNGAIITLTHKFESFLSLMEEKNPQICIFFVLQNYKSNLQPLENHSQFFLKMCIHNTFQTLDYIINSNATFFIFNLIIN
jgi:hypothetical protein